MIRVPYSLIDTVNAMIEAYKAKEAQRQVQSGSYPANKASDLTPVKEVVYSCGCALNGALFRRANGCRLERLKH